ncbi:flagellar biosynthesis protein FlhA [Methylogaea oryzae]|uniref:Flagellar biosynthesis protein FlhA n=1 Tax=Methylogaea oryzae TaxID=1295382 RepID=A0A8D4VSE1_9GAMM|nr:flagellar biosynthesis protein FlhA [Methylogaea oryzae]BBL71500.1 flagellar biosynthesis protein FlhA [Methylogaea oryzae]
MQATAIIAKLRGVGSLGLGAPLLIMLMLMMLTLPLPAFLLDLLFTFNIALSLIILLVAIYTLRPLDFVIFPSVLLVATLLRLGLNVASTRVVLLKGHEGGDAAGKVIEAFGDFVVGGNYAVGIVAFAILTIINFVVVTKGAGRVAEVSARFTLDAMPGKQMAIDADLNAGLINQDEARARRKEVSMEADFYGSMDGASKFVRGDAVAGILILFINMIGGAIVGVLQHHMGFAEAAQTYTLLAIGDGLVAQIPSLLLSIGAAMLVTRVPTATGDIGSQFAAQFLEDPKPLYITAGVVGLLGIIPGMPNVPFLLLAGGMAWGGYTIVQRQKQIRAQAQAKPVPVAPTGEVKELGWDDVAPVDMIGLEIGYRLIPLVDKNQGGQLMQRIKGVRKKLSQDLGFLIPSVHIRDNLDLKPNAYRISLLGVTVGEAEVFPERVMAINPGRVFGPLSGTVTTDPAFGLEAVWVDANQRDQAQSLGYTVVDPGTVIATHLSHILQTQGHQLLGHDEVQQLLDGLAKTAPKLVESLVPKTLPLSVLVKVLQNVLQEGIPIRDIRSIAETLADYGSRSQDPVALTAAVRASLGRLIVQNLCGSQKDIAAITFDSELEQLLLKIVQGTGGDGVGIEPGLAEQMQKALEQHAQRLEMEGRPPLLLVSAPIRQWLARFVRQSIPGLHVLAYNEIPEDRQIKVVAAIGKRG